MRAVNEEGPLPELDPGAALVDLLRFDPDSIDMDDIDWDEMKTESRQIFNALADYAGVDVSRPNATGESLRG
jgi:hypothetical protein